MKLIHLSDLHIGKRLKEQSLIEDQAYILEQILRIADEERPDAVLIAGDVYDKSVPPSEAVTLLDDFLCRLAERRLPVLIISGNHDCPERLAFAGRLLQGAGVYVSPVYNGEVQRVELRDEYGAVDFYLLPFIKPVHVRRFYPEEKIESYTDACAVAVKHMNVDASRRNVLLTHQFVTGASTCESEENSVGGSDNVDACVFDDFDYVALGHLHGPQNIASNRMRYCGTPLKYSFSEADHLKSVTVVYLGQKGDLRLSTLPLIPKHDMRRLRGSFEQLSERAFYENEVCDDYFQVILTDEQDVPDAMNRLRCIYPNIINLEYDNTRTRADGVIEGATDVQRKTPLELFEELYVKQNNCPMSADQRAYVQNLIEEIWEDDACDR